MPLNLNYMSVYSGSFLPLYCSSHLFIFSPLIFSHRKDGLNFHDFFWTLLCFFFRFTMTHSLSVSMTVFDFSFRLFFAKIKTHDIFGYKSSIFFKYEKTHTDPKLRETMLSLGKYFRNAQICQ